MAIVTEIAVTIASTTIDLGETTWSNRNTHVDITNRKMKPKQDAAYNQRREPKDKERTSALIIVKCFCNNKNKS